MKTREVHKRTAYRVASICELSGDIELDCGKVAYAYLTDAAPFVEKFYDWDIEEIREYIDKNSLNDFVRIRFNYRQIGRDEEWFYKQVKDLGGDWAKIRREVLMELIWLHLSVMVS